MPPPGSRPHAASWPSSAGPLRSRRASDILLRALPASRDPRSQGLVRRDGTVPARPRALRIGWCVERGHPAPFLRSQDDGVRGSSRVVDRPPTRYLPAVDEIRHVVGYVNKVGLALTGDLIRDCDAAVARVPDLFLDDGIFSEAVYTNKRRRRHQLGGHSRTLAARDR